jgi:hypothetical protein
MVQARHGCSLLGNADSGTSRAAAGQNHSRNELPETHIRDEDVPTLFPFSIIGERSPASSMLLTLIARN